MSRLVLLALLALALPTADKDKGKEVDPARRKEAVKRFATLPEYCQERRVTHIVELLAEWGEFADANQQDEVMAMATTFRDEPEVKAVFGKTLIQVGYRGTSATTKGKKLYSDASTYFVDEFVAVQPPGGGGDAENCPGKHLIVASRIFTARPNDPAMECVVLSNAPVTEFSGLEKSIVLASGAVAINERVSGAVVVCRGDVQFRRQEKESSLIKAGGKALDTVEVASGGKQPAVPPDAKRVFQNDTKLLGVKFYSTAEDGLEAKADKGVVTVSKLDETKAFGKAGVKKGDVIETVNGEKVPTLHELDRLVCRATVASGVAKLKVKRGEKAEEFEVTLFDWSTYTPDTKK